MSGIVNAIKPPYSAESAVGAIRLAIAGAKDDRTIIRMVEAILENTEVTPADNTMSVRVFLREVELAGGKFEVTS